MRELQTFPQYIISSEELCVWVKKGEQRKVLGWMVYFHLILYLSAQKAKVVKYITGSKSTKTA